MGEFRLRVGPVWTELVAGDADTVDKLLTIADPDAGTSAAATIGLTDGLLHYFNQVRPRAFLAGLTARLVRRLEKRGHSVVLEYDPARVEVDPPPPDCLDGLTLRDHQMEGLVEALRHQRGTLWQATNAGKSAIIAALCYVLAARWPGSTGVIIVPTLTILTGLTKDLRTRLPHLRIGMIGNGTCQTKGADVVVGTYQTFQQACPSRGRAHPVLQRLVELAPYLLVDEAHHASGAVYQRLMQMAYNAVFRIGFSGTIDKNSKRTDARAQERSAPKAVKHRWDVEAVLGPVLFRTTNDEMVTAGFSAQPRVFVVDDRKAYGPTVLPIKQRPPEVNGRRVKPLNVYMETFRRALIEDQTFLRTVSRVTRALLVAGKPPFVFSHSVELLVALSKVMTERGVAHRVLDGRDSPAKRDNVVDLFSRRRDFALLTSSIFDEGANVPEIRAVVFAGARRAVVELLQRIGRGIRCKADDNTLTVVDFRPSHCEVLADHYEERRAVYRAEGFPVARIIDITRLSEVNL